ncbi:AAA family ATPase [Thermodesulfobacteriota bacterium]
MSIHSFGPINHAEIDVSRFLVLIGPQASGKSTIAKLVYYFLHARDEVTAWIIEQDEPGQTKGRARELKKRLRKSFVEFFGPTPQQPEVRITYSYGPNSNLEIALDKEHHKYITPNFSNSIWRQIVELIYETHGKLSRGPGPVFPSTVGKLASEQERAALLKHVRSRCNDIFGIDKELFFIPAGRSLLSTLAEQIQSIRPHLLDYPMRQFVETVNNTKVYFDRSLDDMVRERQALSQAELDFPAIRKARRYVEKVLQGEYRYDREGGKLFVDSNTFTKISYASSGQQEVLWILLSLFLLVLDGSPTLVFIEEPEAHLFPQAQNDITKFVAFVFNEIGCDFLITTHSPYMLSCINNLLYARDLGMRGQGPAVGNIVAEDLWLSPVDVSGYFVVNGSVDPILVPDIPALKSELVDSASEAISDEFEKLLSLEREAVRHAE